MNMRKDKRQLHIEFRFPKSSGEYYDPKEMTAFIFSFEDISIDPILRDIIHAQIHFVIQKLEGITKSRKFDCIAGKVLEWDKDTFCELY